jgi:glycerophosphoryl diester phosphodiesterase
MIQIKPAVEIIGHRGSSRLAPENTLASLKLGWRETTTCELDIHPTLDGRLLVIHDASAKRTTGTDFAVAKHTLHELQRLDAGSWKGPRWKGEKLPSLKEAIAAIPAGKRLLIEIKAGPEVIPELARVIRASGKGKQLLLHSFSYPACVAARKAFPDIPVYLLIAFERDPLIRAWWPSLDKAILKAKTARLAGINVNDAALLQAAAIQKIHMAGLKVHVWTVDRVSDAKRLLDRGVDGLITNRPGWLKAQLASRRNALSK